MKKIIVTVLTLFLVLTNITYVQAEEMGYQSDGTLIIAETEAGNLRENIIKYGVSDDFSKIKGLLITKGTLNNKDLNVLDELENITMLDFSNAEFTDSVFKYYFYDYKLEKPKHRFLKDVSFPKKEDGYTLIAESMMNTMALKKVNLGSVNLVGAEAFKNSSLAEVIIEKEAAYEEEVFANTENLKSVDLSKATTLSKAMFKGSGILNVELPVEEYDLPESFFENTKKLIDVDLSKAQSLGDHAFKDSSVETIVLAESVGLGEEVFTGTKNLKTINLSGANSKQGASMFDGSGIEEITLPKDVELGNCYFKNTQGLQTVDLTSVKSYGNQLFLMSGIEKVILPENADVDTAMFAYTSRLKSMDLSNVYNIENSAFLGSNIERIKLPSEYDGWIKSGTFALTNNLKSLHFQNVKGFEDHVFYKKTDESLIDEEDLKIINTVYERNPLMIDGGLETVVFSGKTIPSISKNTFANMNGNSPLVLLPSNSDWTSFQESITSHNNEVENLFTYDSFLYEDQLVSKAQNVQIGFTNLQGNNVANRPITVSYKWLFNQEEIANANQSTLMINNFNEDKEGTYQLQIIVNDKVYNVYSVRLKENELEIDDKKFMNGYFVNDVIDMDTLTLKYVNKDKKYDVNHDDVELEYNFSSPGQTLVRVIYHKDDADVIADYPVIVANTISDKLKLRKGQEFVYDPGVDGFEFVLTPEAKEALEITKDADSTEITIKASKKYKGDLEYRLNNRTNKVSVKVVGNFGLVLKIFFSAFLVVALGMILYLRKTRGMFKVKRKKVYHE